MKQKETLWILSEMFYPDETSTGYILTHVALGLLDRFSIKALTGPANYQSHSENNSNLKKENYKGISINRTSALGLNKNKVFTRFVRLLYISLAISFKCLFQVKRDAKVLMVTNPVPLLFFMSIIVRLKNIKLYLIVHDVYPDNMVAANILKKNHFLMPVISRLFSFCYDAASTVIVLGRDMKEVLEAKTKTPVMVIENWGQVDSIQPTEKMLKAYQLQHLDKSTNFIFAGNIGRVQGIEMLCEVILQFNNKEEVSFIFAGGGAKLPYLENFITKHRLTNVHLLGVYKREDQTKILNLGDVGIVSLANHMYGLGVPSKTYNLLAAGKPILYIGDKQSEIGRLVKEEKLGWIADINSKKSIEDAINLILKEKKEIPAYRVNARNTAEKKFSYTAILAKYKSILTA